MASNDYFEALKSIRKTSRRISNDIENFMYKIHVKDGFLFFTSHRYSQELSKIRSLSEKLHDDFDHWRYAGCFSSQEIDALNEELEILQSSVRAVQDEICEREPTFWENFSGIVIPVFNEILNITPLGSVFKRLGFVGSLLKNVSPLLIGMGKKKGS